MRIGLSFGDGRSEDEWREEESSVEVMGEDEGVSEGDALVVIATTGRRATEEGQLSGSVEEVEEVRALTPSEGGRRGT